MDCFKLLTSKEGNQLTNNDNLERKKKRFRIHNRFVVNSVMIQHSGGQVKLDLRVCTSSGISVYTDRIFCSTPHVGEYFLLYPRNVEPPPYSSRHKNDVSCREPLGILYQPAHPLTSPTAPKLLPSRSVSTEMQPSPRQRSPRLPSEPLLIRKVSRGVCVCVCV